MERAHIIVSGQVQGVFFRVSTRQKAEELGLKGLVRNLSDGSVEIVAEGDKELLKELVEWCHKGPSGASVTNVKVNWEAASHEFNNFAIR